MRRSSGSLRYAHRVRRIERLINLIAALLETERPMTADDIRSDIAGYDQANFDAFRRAFERDKQDLRAMGIPIEVVPSTNDPFAEQADAYLIPKDRYYLPDLDLEADELAALRVAADAVLGAGQDAASAMMKLSIDSASSPWSGPRVVWGADVAAEQPLLAPIWSAQLERTPISFAYERPDGEVAHRRVQPYGLVHRRGNWYLVGWDIDREAVRSFRLTRIRSDVIREKGTYEVPSDFDARSHVAGEAFELGGEATETARVRFSPALRWWAEQNWPQAESTETAGGGIEVELPVANQDAFISWVVGFADDVEIIEPVSLRVALIEHLRCFLGGTR